MEYCVESRALKSSLRRELSTMKSTTTTTAQQALLEDLVYLNTNIGDDFSVDCFLDFSNGGLRENCSDDEEEDEEEKEILSVFSSQERMDGDNNSNSITLSAVTDNSDSLVARDLSVPADDLADLEWVSQFVDDPVLEFPLLFPVCCEERTESYKNRFETEPKRYVCKSPYFSVHVPSKTRTKRSTTNRRVWSLRSPLTMSSAIPCLLVTNEPGFDKPRAKKPKIAPASQTGGLTWVGQFQRRCSHCQIQKTPQWRTGPLGPKTLCNACGVRYKSGRLFPEYRPACSPTFSSDVHSNSHRRVLEMRKRKETYGPEFLKVRG